MELFSNIEQQVIVKLFNEPEKHFLLSSKYFELKMPRYLLKKIAEKVETKAVYFDPISFSQDCANNDFKQLEIFMYLTGTRPLLESFEYHANILKERFFKTKFKNKLIKAASEISEPNFDFYSLFENFEHLKSEVDSAIDSESETLQTNINVAVDEMYKRIEMFKSGVIDFQTGKKELDEILTITKGDMIILAARPSMGKTSLAVDLAYNFAQNNKKVLFISVEVTKLNLTNKLLLAHNDNVDSNKFKKGRLNEHECNLIEQSLVKFNNLDIFIEDKASFIDDIVRLIAIEKRKRDIDICFIDYAQLIKVEKDNGVVQNTTEISKKIKSAAKDNNIPIVLLSQLNRGSESRGDNNYQLSDLRGSGSLEEDADVIGFIHRDYRADQLAGADLPDWNDPKTRTMDLFFRKNRNGECGDVKFYHNKTVTRFFDEIEVEELPNYKNEISNNDIDEALKSNNAPF